MRLALDNLCIDLMQNTVYNVLVRAIYFCGEIRQGPDVHCPEHPHSRGTGGRRDKVKHLGDVLFSSQEFYRAG